MATAAVTFEERIRIPANVFDLENFCRWMHSDEYPEHGKVSFIFGEVVIDMSPEEIETHSALKGDLFAQLWLIVRQQKLGRLLPDGTLFTHAKAEISTEPDILFCSREALRTNRARTVEVVKDSNRFVELVGSPDLIVEIVSQNSVRKDTQLLREGYYTAGIREYWLIDARKSQIDFKLLIRGNAEFVESEADEEGFQKSEVFDSWFRLTRTWDDVEGFSYLLHSR